VVINANQPETGARWPGAHGPLYGLGAHVDLEVDVHPVGRDVGDGHGDERLASGPD
jgi:hypothetical protein